MTPEKEFELLDRMSRVDERMGWLVNDGGTKGMVPELKGTVERHSDQINFWKGAIAVISFCLLVFGGVLLAHVLGGAK